MLLEGGGEGGARLHIRPDIIEGLFEGLVVLLLGEDIEALDQRESGIDHCRKLPSDDGQVSLADLPPKAGDLYLNVLRLGFY